MKSGPPETERLNLYLPKALVEDLKQLVPARERTRFVCDALAREIRRLKLKAAIEVAAGAWRDEDHPDLATSSDIDRWIEEGREAQGWDQIAGESGYD